TLVFRHDGTETLATMEPTDASRAAGLAAALSATVAELHAMGVVHHRLTADHVIVSPARGVVVCGLAEAGPGDAADDIRQLATLFELLATSVAPGSGAGERRTVRGLLALAERARGADGPPP